jgi:hypothetical protein
MRDELDEKIFNSIRSKKVSADGKMCALVRVGQIAHSYLGTSKDSIESVFGDSDTLQNDGRDHSAAS